MADGPGTAAPHNIWDATVPGRGLKVNADGSINAGLVVESVEIGKVDPSNGATTDGSGTVAAGGTAQQVFAANTARKWLLIANDRGSSEPLWVNFGTAAVQSQPSFSLEPGERYESGAFVSTELVSVIAATTGHAFTAKQG